MYKRKPLQEVTPQLALDHITSVFETGVAEYLQADAELTVAVEGLRTNLHLLRTGGADPEQPALFEL